MNIKDKTSKDLKEVVEKVQHKEELEASLLVETSTPLPGLNPSQFSKREYIAIMAMQGLLSKDNAYGYNVLVKIAIDIADLLLKELEGEEIK